MTIEVVPVGWVESPLTEMARAPMQPDEGAPPAWLVFEADVADALRDLRPGTEILVLTWLDRADRGVLLTIPYGDPRNAENAMEAAPDRYRYILERPMVGEPYGSMTTIVAPLPVIPRE